MKFSAYLSILILMLSSCGGQTLSNNIGVINRLADLNAKRIDNLVETTEMLGAPYAGIKRIDLFLSEWHKTLAVHLRSESIPIDIIKSQLMKLEKLRWDEDADLLIDLFKKNIEDPSTESVLLNEVELIDKSLELLNSKFRLFDIARPVILGDRNLKLNQTDTLKFVFQGASSYTRILVYFGDIDELMQSTEGLDEATEFSNGLFANYHVIQASEKGSHELTGVMIMLDKDGERKMPFRYTYTVE